MANLSKPLSFNNPYVLLTGVAALVYLFGASYLDEYFIAITANIKSLTGKVLNGKPVLRHFKPSEFDNYEKMDNKTLLSLDALREAWGRPITVTSDYRGTSTNDNVGGKKDSQHLAGRAVDIVPSGITPSNIRSFYDLAVRSGFTGIGIYTNFGSPVFHLDTRPGWARWSRFSVGGKLVDYSGVERGLDFYA